MDREKKGARPTDRAGALRAEPVPVSGKAAHPSRGQLPLIIRFGIRLAKFVAGAFAIGLASALAEHFLVGGRHYDLISKTDLAVYRGALNMLLVLWFFDLLRRDTDRSGEADETAKQAQPEARAGAGTASPNDSSLPPDLDNGG